MHVVSYCICTHADAHSRPDRARNAVQHPLNNAYAAEAQACEALQAALQEVARCEEEARAAYDALAHHDAQAAPELARLQQQVGARLVIHEAVLAYGTQCVFDAAVCHAMCHLALPNVVLAPRNRRSFCSKKQMKKVCNAGELDELMKQGTKRCRGEGDCALQPSQPRSKARRGQKATRQKRARSGRDGREAAAAAMEAAGLEDDDVDL